MIHHKKYSRQQKLELIELRLLQTRTQYLATLHPIIKKLLGKRILDIYDKGGQDMLSDWKYISRQFKRLGIKV